MDSDSKIWQKLRSGLEIRGPKSAFTDARAEKIGYAFACRLAERGETTPDALKLAAGRDECAGGSRIEAALIRGITAADSDVLDCGLCPGPALFRQVPEACDGAVMVSAGASGPEQIVLKFITASGGLSAAEIDQILIRAQECEVPERLVVPTDAAVPYYRALRLEAARCLKDDALRPLLGLRVVVDACSDVGRGFAKFLEDLGVEVSDSLSPGAGEALADPQAPARVEAMARAVCESRADMGVLFNTDGGRVAFVDDRGRLIAGNRLIALTAAMLLDEQPGSTFVTDSVTSSGLSAFIAEWGGVHYRFKRGYRNVIDEAARLNAEGIDCPLAMETSGHSAFRDNRFLDDGIYLAARIICQALDRKREGQNIFSLIDDLKEPVESVEIRLPVTDEEDPSAAGQEAVEMLLSHTLEDAGWQPAPDNREGVRITFNLDGGVNNAWFQLRMSVHDPVMVLNAQSDVAGGVKRILAELYQVIHGVDLLDVSPLKAHLETV